MEPKDYLRQMIDNTIDGDTEAAEQSFKSYIVPKTIEVLGINPVTPKTDADVVDDPAPAEVTDVVVDDPAPAE